MAKNKLYWKKEEKQKETNKQTKKPKEVYPLVLYTVNPSTSPGAFQDCSVKTLLSPIIPAGFLGEGPAVLMIRCVQGSVGAVYPERPLFPGGPTLSRHRVTPGGTITLVAASFLALELFLAVTTAVSQSSPHWSGCSRGRGC